MALFTYRSVDSQGRKQSGERLAKSESELVATLGSEGLFALDVKEKKSRFTRRWKPSEKIEMMQNLSDLLESGLPLFESLELLSTQNTEARRSARGDIIYHLRSKVGEGENFASAMETSGHFTALDCAFARAGLESGNLPAALTSLKNSLARSEGLRKKIVAALIYPTVLISLALGAVSTLLLFAVPSIEEFVDIDTAGVLTRSVIFLSHIMRDYGAWLIAALGIFGFAVYRWLGPFFTRQLSRFALIRQFIDEVALSRYCALVGELTSAQVQLPQALALSRLALGTGRLKEVLEDVEERLRSGESLAQLTLEKVRDKQLPAYLAQMIVIGERGSNIAGAFKRIGVYYTNRAHNRLEMITQFIQPALLVFIGLLIGLIMLAILVPMTELSGLELGG